MHFDAFPVTDLASLSHLIAPTRRRGIYILEFADGQRYVGQSTNVVSRFAAHRRRFDDIVAARFSWQPSGPLSPLEIEVIHHQQREGRILRNQRFALGAPGASALDLVVTPREQDAWLTADIDDILASDRGGGARPVEERQRRQSSPAWQRFRASANAPLAVEQVGYYLESAVPRARETEGRFWSVSAAPSTGASPMWRRLAAVSIHSMETLVVGESTVAGLDAWVPRGFVVVSRSTLERDTGGDVSTLARQLTPFVSFLAHGYEAAGGDDITLHWTGTDESLLALDELPWERAAAVLATRLMRKGRSMQTRWHNTLLADAAFNGFTSA